MSAAPAGRLLRWMRPMRGRFALALLLGALTIGSSMALMATSAWLIASAALRPSIADLATAVVGVRFFGIARGVLRYLERLVSHDATLRLLARIRVDLYRAIEPLAPAGLDALHSGDLVARWVGDVEVLQNVYLRALAPPLVALITAAGLAIFLAAFDARAALILILIYLAMGAGQMLLAHRMSAHAGRDLVRSRGRLDAALVDALQGMPDLLAADAGRALAGLTARCAEHADHERTLARTDAVLAALATAAPATLMLAALALTIGRVDGLWLAALALACAAACEALAPLGTAAAAWGSSQEAARRLFALTDAAPTVAEPPHPAAPPASFDLEIRGLRFRYAAGLPPAIDGLDLTIAQGERVAIAGESGAGKSTLAQILLRLREFEAGSVRVGGVDLRALPLEEVRRTFALMEQRTHLFDTTLRENIRLARMEASDAEVEQAARAARIHDFVAALPAGYETLAGENGVKLSGGERQRIALARLLLSRAPILILDEATAHLDATTEAEVMRSLLEASAGRTVILFTHSPGPLALADRVVALPRPHALGGG